MTMTYFKFCLHITWRLRLDIFGLNGSLCFLVRWRHQNLTGLGSSTWSGWRWRRRCCSITRQIFKISGLGFDDFLLLGLQLFRGCGGRGRCGSFPFTFLRLVFNQTEISIIISIKILLWIHSLRMSYPYSIMRISLSFSNSLTYWCFNLI